MAGFTQAKIDALKEALSTGARSITVAGQTTIFRDMSEMLQLLTIMQDEVARNENGITQRYPSRFRGFKMNRGFYPDYRK